MLVGLLVLGGYGIALDAVQTMTYLKANEWVALLTGVLGAGCSLYVAAMFAGRLNGRQILALCVVSGVISVFAVAKGVPAVRTMAEGKPATVAFTVTGHGSGGRGCRDKVFARNDKYEEFSICAQYLPREVEAGDELLLRGKASDWGLVHEDISVR